MDRTTAMAIGNAAIHAPRRLLANPRFRQGNDEIAEVLDPLLDWRIAVIVASDFQKTGGFTHDLELPQPVRLASLRRAERAAWACISCKARR